MPTRDTWDKPERNGLERHQKTSITDEKAGKKQKKERLWEEEETEIFDSIRVGERV